MVLLPSLFLAEIKYELTARSESSIACDFVRPLMKAFDTLEVIPRKFSSQAIVEALAQKTELMRTNHEAVCGHLELRMGVLQRNSRICVPDLGLIGYPHIGRISAATSVSSRPGHQRIEIDVKPPIGGQIKEGPGRRLTRLCQPGPAGYIVAGADRRIGIVYYRGYIHWAILGNSSGNGSCWCRPTVILRA